MITNLLAMNHNTLREVSSTQFVSLASVRAVLNQVSEKMISTTEAYQYARGSMAFQADNMDEINEEYLHDIFEEYGPGPVTGPVTGSVTED